MVRITAADFDESGEMLVLGCSNGKIILWNIKQHKLVRVLAKEEHLISHVLCLDDPAKIVFSTVAPDLKGYNSTTDIKRSFEVAVASSNSVERNEGAVREIGG